MSAITVRRAGEGDIAAIATIYNQGIEDRVATLETELRTPDERREWLTSRSERHPVLVAERDGRVIAWASLVYSPGVIDERSAWRIGRRPVFHRVPDRE